MNLGRLEEAIKKYQQAIDLDLSIQCLRGTEIAQGTGTATIELTGRVTAERVKCFIASAAFGTSLYPRLNILRNWRDETLNKSKFLRQSIKFYYSLSPPFAQIVTRSRVLRKITQRILGPIISTLYRLHPNWIDYSR